MTDPAPAKRLVLIDGSGYIFRAFFALPPMTRPDGTPVNAVFGFANMLLRLLQEPAGTTTSSSSSTPAATSFRNDLYADYKANRDEPPPELMPQFPLVREAARAFGLPVIERRGLRGRRPDRDLRQARRAPRASRCVVVSSDKDLMQLVADGVEMWDPMKQKHDRARRGGREVRRRAGAGAATRWR